MKNLVSWFKNIGINDRPTVGGKGASLGELVRAGIRVPPGCVLTTAGFERFLAAIDPTGAIRRAVERLAADDLVEISRVSEELRNTIENSALPPDLGEAVISAYRELCGSEPDAPVAIRSSATSEDSADASFAGLQDTYLWVCGESAVLAAVRACWASLYSAESVSYRLRLNLPEEGLAMGVVMQRMVNSRCSGVMFTRSPVTGDRSVIAIEASWGLGSSIVSGEVTPDKYVVNKVTGEIAKRTVSKKMVQHVPDPENHGTVSVHVSDVQQMLPSLSDGEIAELAAIAKRVERHYGSCQDIEWAIGHDSGNGAEVYLLQSRPETVWSRRDAEDKPAPKARAFEHVFDLFAGKK